MQNAALLFLATVMLSGPQESGDKDASLTSIKMMRCVVSPIKDIRISAKEAGMLIELNVKEGAEVKKESLLGRIDDADSLVRKKAAEFELSIAKKQAESDLSVRESDMAADVAEAEVKVSEEVNAASPGAVSKNEIRRQRLTEQRLRLQAEVARLEQLVAGITSQVREAQVEAADNDIKKRQIKSPLNGMVVEKFRHAGEWVTAGEPILRMVEMERLKVQGWLKIADVEPKDIFGREITVEITMKNGRIETFKGGKIEFVSPLIENGGEYRVWASVQNRKENGFWVMLPGQVAEMTIILVDNRTVSLDQDR